MGRTGTLFAYEQESIAPDIVCVAKGLGAGYQPIGATICTDKIYSAIKDGSGFFQHGHTYIGHPLAAAAANAVLDVLLEYNGVGVKLDVDTPNGSFAARVVDLPFYDPNKNIAKN